jgi:hypothetical protein
MDNSGFQPDQAKNNQENINKERNQRNNHYILHDVENANLKQNKK